MFNEVCAEELTPKDKPQTEFELFHINTILLISHKSVFSTRDNQVFLQIFLFKTWKYRFHRFFANIQ